MIVTLTMNPAIDRTVIVDSMILGQTNRIQDVHVGASGKGVNVSRALIKWGVSSVAMGFLGGSEGEFIYKALETTKIEPKFTWLAGNGTTRTNTKIYEHATKQTTELNERGPEITEKDEAAIWQVLDEILPHTRFLVCSGSLPRGICPSFYYDLTQKCNRLGVSVCLDASGLALAKAVKAGPYLVKPNKEELESLLDRQMEDEFQIAEAIHYLSQFGISVIVVSLGADGAIFYRKGQPLFWAKAVASPVNSTSGCGDSLVAAVVLALSKGMCWEETVRWSVATATATAELIGTDFPEVQHIESIIPRVDMKEMKNRR